MKSRPSQPGTRADAARPGPAKVEKILEFQDNLLLGQLFGEFDQHLALIEHRLGIEAAARGNRIFLSGSQEACERAQAILNALYARLERGASINAGDVDGEIKLSATTQRPHPQSKEQAHQAAPDGPARIETRKRFIAARSATQDAYIRALERCEMVFATGPAGTGKTYLAVAFAAAWLERGRADRIILSRPAIEAGERLGFLPGDMREKIDPYLRPLYDGLYDVMAPERVERGLQTGVIEIAPLAFMRGRTLTNAAIILDEAQNCTPMQMKMFLTRLGENSRMIITGDPSQDDLPAGQASGLREALDLLKDVKGIAQIEFTAADVVRHELVAKIVEAYDNAGRSKTAARRGRDGGH